jgi:hypothetical protein
VLRGARGRTRARSRTTRWLKPAISPEVVKSYGFGQLPDVTRGRKEVKCLTGESWVPVLELNDGEVVTDSKNIAAWARDNPATVAG